MVKTAGAKVRTGEYYGMKLVDVILPRKSLTIISNKYLYPKPTQVGK